MAHWIKPRNEGAISYGPGYVECSNCHRKVWLPREYSFCPYCGQRVDSVITDIKTNWIKLAEQLPDE